MLWSYLNKRQLQENISEEYFERFEKLLPILLGDDHEPTELYSKESLIKLFNAFAPINILNNQNFLFTIFNQLPEDKIRDLCELVGINNKDTFNNLVNKLSKLDLKDDKYCDNFIRWANLPEYFKPLKKHIPIKKEVVQSNYRPFKSLKDYQFSVYDRAMSLLETPRSRFVIQMPTGSGKTRTSMEIIVQHILSQDNGGVYVWLAHSQELCEQSIECFKEVWVHLSDKPITLCRCWGSNISLPYDDSTTCFIVASFQGLYSLLRKNQIPFNEINSRVKIVIIDEAHKVIAPTYKKVTKALVGTESSVIGLTATPGRSTSELDENRELSEFFFNKILSIEPPKGKSVIDWLKNKKILSKVQYEPLLTNITYKLNKKTIRHLETLYDFPAEFISELGQDDLRNLEIVKRLENELKTDSRVLFFACSVDHSKFICSILLYLGFKAAHIDGSTEETIRKKNIDDFKEGKIQVLCNYGVLSTGFDAPQTDVVFISRPTASIVLYSQMIGRGLRGPAIGGTSSCKIIDVKDNIEGFPDQNLIYDYFEDYWDQD